MASTTIGSAPTADRLAQEAYLQTRVYQSTLNGFLSRLYTLASSGPTTSSISIPDIDVNSIYSALSQLGTDSITSVPTMQESPGVPVLPTITPLAADSSAIAVPTINMPTAPNITAPRVPNIAFAAFTGAAPTVITPTAPTRPTVSLPAPPSLGNIAIPAISDVALPSFMVVAPADDLTAPTELFMFSEVGYTSVLRDDLTRRLRQDFDRTTPTGYGLDDSDELRLYGREVARGLHAAAVANAEVSRQTAARGFASPPGALMTQLADIQKQALGKASEVSQDIYIKRGDAYRENRRWVHEQLADVEKANVALHLNVMERSLNAAKISADVGTAIYNSRVARFRVLIDSYQASVGGYEAQVRGALGAVEAQKLKLEATQAEVGIQRNQVEVYNAQVDGAKALLDVYQTDVSAMVGLIQVEALKLQAFKSQVEVYSEQMKAGTLQLQAYESLWRGEQTKNEVYKTQVESQKIIVDAARVQADMATANMSMRAEAVRTQVAVMQGTVEAYKAQVSGVASANQSATSAFSARSEAYRSLASVYSNLGNIVIGEYDAKVRTAIAQMQDATSRLKIQDDLSLGATTAATDASTKALQGMLNQVISIASTVSSV